MQIIEDFHKENNQKQTSTTWLFFKIKIMPKLDGV